jgi:small-conductance mechanosensitive channel
VPAVSVPAVPSPASEVLGRFLPAEQAAALPPEIQASLGERLTQIQDWALQTQEYYQTQAQQMQQQYEGAIQQLQAQLQGQPAGQPPKPNQPTPEFESPGEEHLFQQLQAQSQVVDGLRGQLDQVTQQLNQVLSAQDGQRTAMQTQAAGQFNQQIEAAEKALSAEYPDMFKSEASIRKVYQLAAAIHKSRMEVEKKAPSVDEVLRQACVLADPNGSRRVEQAHLERMRGAVGQRTLPGSPRPGPQRQPQTEREIAEQVARERGLID